MFRFCLYAVSLLLLLLAGVSPLAAQTPVTTEETEAPTYIVQFVEPDAVLNVYAEPDDQSAVVGTLFNGEELQATGDTMLVTDQVWLPVSRIYGNPVVGWIERLYVVEHLSAETFCADETASGLVDTVRSAIRAQNGDQLAATLIPERGLYVGSLNWSDTVHLSQVEVQTFFTDTTVRNWGSDGYGSPSVQGTLSELIIPLLKRDLLARNATVACEDTQDGRNIEGVYGNDYSMNQLLLYSVERPGARGHELDWGAWAVGIDYWEGAVKLVYLSHYDWTP